MAIPADSSASTFTVDTNATVNVYGPWALALTTTTDTQLLSISNPLLNLGNPSFPNSVEVEIGAGDPTDPPTQITTFVFQDSDAGSSFQSLQRGRIIIPWKLVSGTKVSVRIKATEGPGGVFSNAIQVVAMET